MVFFPSTIHFRNWYPADEIEATKNAASLFARFIANWAVTLKRTQIYCGFMIPLNVINIFYDSKHYLLDANPHEKSDIRYRILGEMSHLLFNSSIFALGLKDLKWIADSSARWAGPLSVLCIPLRVGTFIVKARGSVRAESLRRQIEKEGLQSIDLSRDLLIKHEFQISDVKRFRNVRHDDTFTKALRDRLWSKRLSDSLTTIAIAISLVAIASLLLLPFAPVGYFMLALGLMLEGGLSAYDQYCNFRFARDSGMGLSSLPIGKVMDAVKGFIPR